MLGATNTSHSFKLTLLGIFSEEIKAYVHYIKHKSTEAFTATRICECESWLDVQIMRTTIKFNQSHLSYVMFSCESHIGGGHTSDLNPGILLQDQYSPLSVSLGIGPATESQVPYIKWHRTFIQSALCVKGFPTTD